MVQFCLFLAMIPQFFFTIIMTEPPPVMDQVIRSQIQQLDTAQMESFWRQFQKEYGQFFAEKKPPDLFELFFNKREDWGIRQVLSALVRYFFHEVLYSGKLLGTVIVLTVFSMILQTLQTAFEQNQVSRVAYAIVFMVIILLAVQSFSVAIDSAKKAISQMIDFMLALIPLMLTLLASMGNITSVSLFHPFIVFMIHVVGTFIHIVIFPILFFSTVLSIVSSLSEKYKVNQLADLMRKISITLMGGLLTIFLGVISVQGASAAVVDGITIRTAKYLTGNFVPVIGRTISEAADTVIGASLLVKNTVGIAGVMVLLFICAFPALKVLSLAFIYHFASAVMQPLGHSPIIECLSTIGRTLIYVFAALAVVGLMFFLSVTILIVSANLSIMLR